MLLWSLPQGRAQIQGHQEAVWPCARGHGAGPGEERPGAKEQGARGRRGNAGAHPQPQSLQAPGPRLCTAGETHRLQIVLPVSSSRWRWHPTAATTAERGTHLKHAALNLHFALPLCFWQINVLQAKKKFEILDAVSCPDPWAPISWCSLLMSVSDMHLWCISTILVSPADAVLHACPVHTVPAGLSHPGWDRSLHEKAGCAGETKPTKSHANRENTHSHLFYDCMQHSTVAFMDFNQVLVSSRWLLQDVVSCCFMNAPFKGEVTLEKDSWLQRIRS